MREAPDQQEAGAQIECACPCKSIDEARAKPALILESPLIIDSIGDHHGDVKALIRSFVAEAAS